MREYTKCDKCKNKSKRFGDYPCNECINGVKDHCTPNTNADRIRNMTDSELGSFLIAMQIATKVRNKVDSKQEIDEYLQAEVEEVTQHQ